MSRNKYKILNPIEPEEVKDISTQEKSNLMLNGYRPYQTEDGSIRWFTVEQRSYKLMKGMKHNKFTSFFRSGFTKSKRNQHKHQSNTRKFFRKHTLFLLLLIMISAAILLTLKYFYLIF